MERQWHEVVIEHDDGDSAFAAAAPLLAEALQLIESTNTLNAAVQVGDRLATLSSAMAHDGAPRKGSTQSIRRALDTLDGIKTRLRPHLDAVMTTFAHVQETSSSEQPPSLTRRRAVSVRCDGLVAPGEVQLQDLITNHPMMHYGNFRRTLERLEGISANAKLFTACEPRLKVIHSRYALYRAYNGTREDNYHPTVGGGDLQRAPKVDVRRLETCMSAKTLIDYIERVRREAPDYVVHSSTFEEDAPQDSADSEGSNTTNDNKKAPHSSGSGVRAEATTVEDLFRRFFEPGLKHRPDIPLVLTAEGLCLRPNYAQGDGRWMDLQSNDNGNRHVKEFLQHFLSINNDNRGELFAGLVAPVIRRILASSGTNMDVLELEVTVTGLHSGELERIAKWCFDCDLLSHDRIQFSINVTQGSYQQGASNRRGSGSSAAPTAEDQLRQWYLYGDGGKAPSSHSTEAGGRQPETNRTATDFAGVLENIFEPIWTALLAPQEHTAMAKFLSKLAGFSVSCDASLHTVGELPKDGSPIAQYPPQDGIAPPAAFFVFHIRRNVELLNCFGCAHRYFSLDQKVGFNSTAMESEEGGSIFSYFLPAKSLYRRCSPIIRAPLHVRLHGSDTSDSRALFSESILGLLLSHEVVNPSYTFEWAPLAYLYFLAQRHIILTPSRNRSANATVKDVLMKSIPFVVRSGMNASIATLDPLFYHAMDDALTEELETSLKEYELASADVTEMCLRSMESRAVLEWNDCAKLFGAAWPHARARYNQTFATQVNSLRLRHREEVLSHEFGLVCRHGIRPVTADTAPQCTLHEWGCAQSERNCLYDFYFVPPPRVAHPPPDRDSHGENSDDKEAAQGLSTRYIRGEERLLRYPRIRIAGPQTSGPSETSKALARCMVMRQRYQQFVGRQPLLDLGGQTCTTNVSYKLQDGVFDVVLDKKDGPASASARGAEDALKVYYAALPTWKTFQDDMRHLRAMSTNARVQKFAQKRLDMLECKYRLHVALTNDDEKTYHVASREPRNKSSSSPPAGDSTTWVARRDKKGDLYKCVKVDVHCHMAGGFTAKSLLGYIKRKVEKNSDDVVGVDKRTGRAITLAEMFDELLAKLQPPPTSRTPLPQSLSRASHSELLSRLRDLSISSLEVQAAKTTFNRFDDFNSRYSPMGESALRSLFLKTENFMGGRYFAELIREETFAKQEREGNTFSEYRLSIYGRDPQEWERLASWFVLHGMSHHTNRWMVQVPRLYALYRRSGTLKNFEEMLVNIFAPLWEASVHPDRHPFLSHFLSHLSGFDSVDNESDRERDEIIACAPRHWTRAENPPYAYYMYYMWANITTLNRFRATKGLSTFDFRPHGGESGDPDHMADVFLLADGIGHGINLSKRPTLQYLYFLAQIPLGIVPLSNNALFCKYAHNPFATFFRRGLNVALATDGALMFHHTEQPLLEEYSTARNFWDLSAADICELARNSVLMSGFPAEQKARWLGPLCATVRSAAGNDNARSGVPVTRCAFRYEVYLEEVAYLETRAAMEIPNKAMRTPAEEALHVMDVLGCERLDVLMHRGALDTLPAIAPTTTAVKSSGKSAGNMQSWGHM